jgi:hypothetical protein
VEPTRNNTSVSGKSGSPELALRIAAEHCLLNYPTLYTAGLPRQGPRPSIWTVPIVIVRPEGEVVGTVGELIIDTQAAKVVGGTVKESVLAAGKELARANRNGAKTASGSAARKRG